LGKYRKKIKPYQHVLGQPAFVPGDDTSDSESKALLPEQGVTTISTAKGTNLPAGGKVSDHYLLRITWPVIDYLPWNKQEKTGHSKINRRKLVTLK
jgi:hypothetical protein